MYYSVMKIRCFTSQSATHFWVSASQFHMFMHLDANQLFHLCMLYAQSPLDAFPCSFPIDGEVANLLRHYGLASVTANYLDMSR